MRSLMSVGATSVSATGASGVSTFSPMFGLGAAGWMVVCAAAFAACGDKDTDTQPDDTDDTETTTGEDTFDTDLEEPTGPLILTGTLVDAAGAPVSEMVRVQYCRGDECRTATRFQNAVFSFYDLPEGPGSFEIVDLNDANTRVSVFAPIPVSTTMRTLDVVIPNASPAVTLPGAAAWTQVTPGLELELTAGMFTPASPFDPAVDAVWGASAGDAPLPVEGAEGTLKQMFYLEPFDAVAEAGIQVRIADAWSLPEGSLSLWYADYETSSWTKISDLASDGAGKLTATGTLPKLTTLAVMQAP
jgi:hypothetical protein